MEESTCDEQGMQLQSFQQPRTGEGPVLCTADRGCERYCYEHGLDLDRSDEFSFRDEGLTGFTGEHLGDEGQLARFLGLVKCGRIERGSTLVATLSITKRLAATQTRVPLAPQYSQASD
jgi:hypothetical protein